MVIHNQTSKKTLIILKNIENKKLYRSVFEHFCEVSRNLESILKVERNRKLAINTSKTIIIDVLRDYAEVNLES